MHREMNFRDLQPPLFTLEYHLHRVSIDSLQTFGDFLALELAEVAPSCKSAHYRGNAKCSESHTRDRVCN